MPVMEQQRGWDVASIADLPPDKIAGLPREKLVAIIRAVDYPFAGKDRLETFDRDTLQRVVKLIQRWCLNRTR